MRGRGPVRNVDLDKLRAAGAVVGGVNLKVLAESIRPALDCSEKEFQKSVITFAQAAGYAAAHFRKVRVQRKNGSIYFETPVAADGKGFLDLELVRESPPRFIKAELKTERGVIEDEQKVWIRRYEAVGIPAFVWRPRDWDAIVECLSRE